MNLQKKCRKIVYLLAAVEGKSSFVISVCEKVIEDSDRWLYKDTQN